MMDFNRKSELANLLFFVKSLTIEKIKKIEEQDPQYISLTKLKDRGDFSPYVVGAALNCYQLSATGEQFWEEFANYFLEHDFDLRSFLLNSRTNNRLISTKLKRLNRFMKIFNEIHSNLDFVELWDLLNRAGFNKFHKTTLFSIKMFGYSKRIFFNKFFMFPMEIPIPVDSRIKRLFFCKNSQSYWSKVAKDIGIPPLHLDAVLWNWEKIKRKEIVL